MVGLVMADITDPFYAKVLESFSEKLQSVGQRVLLFSIAKVHDIDQALPALLQYQVDGVIITSAVLSSAMAETCAKAGKPVILFNRYVRETTTSAVCTDNVAAGRQVANLLIDAGHRRVAFIAGTANTSTSNDRQRGFLDRLAERGAPAPLVDRGDYRYEGGFAAAERLFARDDPPDAVFCANDVMAMGAMDLIRGVQRAIDGAGAAIVMPLVGRYATSMEMTGVTMTLCKLDGELEALLKAPASCAFWRV